jgi:hypothetical protein
LSTSQTAVAFAIIGFAMDTLLEYIGPRYNFSVA